MHWALHCVLRARVVTRRLPCKHAPSAQPAPGAQNCHVDLCVMKSLASSALLCARRIFFFLIFLKACNTCTLSIGHVASGASICAWHMELRVTRQPTSGAAGAWSAVLRTDFKTVSTTTSTLDFLHLMNTITNSQSSLQNSYFQASRLLVPKVVNVTDPKSRYNPEGPWIYSYFHIKVSNCFFHDVDL